MNGLSDTERAFLRRGYSCSARNIARGHGELACERQSWSPTEYVEYQKQVLLGSAWLGGAADVAVDRGGHRAWTPTPRK